MPSHNLHKKWQRVILGEETEIDVIIDFPDTCFNVSEEEIKEAVERIRKREPAVDISYYKKWLKTHDPWRDFLPEFLYIILKKFGEKYFKGAIIHVLLDSFAPRLSKIGQADTLTFKAIIDYYRKELAKCFDDSLFDDVFKSVEEHLDEILKDIAKEHRVVYKSIRPEDIVQIEIYYDSRTVNKENLEFIKQVLEKSRQYKIKIIERQLDKMNKIEIRELALRIDQVCMLLKISARISRQYTLGKELVTFLPEHPFRYYIKDGNVRQEDSIILFVKYFKEKEIFYPHTPSKEMRFYQWVYPIDFARYIMDKIKLASS